MKNCVKIDGVKESGLNQRNDDVGDRLFSCR